MENRDVERAFRVTLAVAGTLLGLYLLYELRVVVVVVLLAALFALAVNPLVGAIEHNVRRVPAIFAAYLLVGIGGLAVWLTAVPALVGQVNEMAPRVPALLQQIQAWIGRTQSSLVGVSFVPDLATELERAFGSFSIPAGGLLRLDFSGAGGIGAGLLALVTAFYFLLDPDGLPTSVFRLVPARRRSDVEGFVRAATARLGAYVRAQFFLGLWVAATVYILLAILRFDFGFSLAVIAGVTEVVPLVGPALGALPALAVAFLKSPSDGLLVLVLYILVQQVESNLLVPKLLDPNAGIGPVTLLLTLLAGGALLGLVGLVVAFPVAAAVEELRLRRSPAPQPAAVSQPVEAPGIVAARS